MRKVVSDDAVTTQAAERPLQSSYRLSRKDWVMRYLLLLTLLTTCVVWIRRRSKRRIDGEAAAGTVLDMAWSWLLSWWPRPPSTVAVTNRLVRWARAERLPI